MNIVDNNSKGRSWIMITSLLIIVQCLAMTPSLAYVPLVPAIKKTIIMTFTQVGLFSGLAGVLAIVCAIPAGMAIKRFGARKTLIPTIVFMIAGLLLLSVSKSFAGALSGRGIWQIGLRFVIPAAQAAIVVSAPDKYRSTILGISVAVWMVFTIIAQNIGASMSQLWGWPSAIQFFAVIVTVAALLWFFFYRGEAASTDEMLKGEKAVETPDGPKPRSVYAMPSVWLLCLLVIFAVEEGLVDGFAVLQMDEKWGTSAVAFARIISIGMFIGIFVNIGGGWCGDRFGRWNMLIVTGCLNTMVGICLLIGQFDNKAIYIAGLLIAKAVQATTTLFLNSMAPTFLGGRDIGPIIAIIAFGAGIAQFICPQIMGILRDVTGSYTAGWVFAIFNGAMATLIAIGFKIYYDRKEKAAATDIKA